MGESRPSEEAIALFTNVFGYAPDPEALHAGECWQAERIDAALRAAKVEALREMKTALTSQSGTSAWDVVSYIEARIVDHIAKLDARAAQIEEGE